MIDLFFRNPLTLWMNWFFRTTALYACNAGKGLRVGYLASARDCRLGAYCTLQTRSGMSLVSLGDFSYVGSGSVIARATVGKFCSIGPEVMIGLGRHPTRGFVSTHPIFYSTLGQSGITFAEQGTFEEYAAVKVGNDVWIGARAIIADGVTIGDGAIIAAGAVVTENVPAYVIVGGVPAKKIRQRFADAEVETLLNAKWWDRDLEWLRKNYKNFHHLEKFNAISAR